MKSKKGFSNWSNMSLGFLPVIITMLLSKFIPADWSVYWGTASGILFSAFYYFLHKPQGIHFILFTSTTVLIIFSFIAFIMGTQNEWPLQLLPLTLEITILFPLLLLFFNRTIISNISYNHRSANDLKERVRIATFTLSCIRIYFALIVVHFAFIAVGLVVTRSLDNDYMRFVLYVAPILVFILSIIIGQIELHFLKDIEPPEFVPVITPQGGVIGRIDKNLASEYKNEHTHPVIRIAVVSQDMLFLAKRSEERVVEKGKVDILLETYLLYQEDIISGVERLLKETFPKNWTTLKPEFSIKHKFRNDETDRIIFLFILDLGREDAILSDPKFENGKLWTFQQIEDNLEQHYFSEMFEAEYDHLKLIIETRGIYKES